MSVIYVVAGHSIHAQGAVAYNGRTEHEYNVALQREVYNLRRDYGVVVILEDESKSLIQTINYINATSKRGDMIVDIHHNHNYPSATGTEVFIHPNTGRKNRCVATKMVKSISEIIDIPVRRYVPSRDYKYPVEANVGSLGIIEKTFIPAILLEVCFLNERDMKKYIGKEKRVAAAILEAYGKSLTGR